MAKATSASRKGTLNEPRTLCTIGYEGVTQKAVIDALHDAGVKLLVDVRAVAASRRPGFAKSMLAAGLKEAGIGYLHLRDLGTPASGRTAARVGHHAEMHRIYERHLQGVEAQAALGELQRLVEGGTPACLLCLERDPAHCHRTLIVEALAARIPLKVDDLLPAI